MKVSACMAFVRRSAGRELRQAAVCGTTPLQEGPHTTIYIYIYIYMTVCHVALDKAEVQVVKHGRKPLPTKKQSVSHVWVHRTASVECMSCCPGSNVSPADRLSFLHQRACVCPTVNSRHASGSLKNQKIFIIKYTAMV